MSMKQPSITVITPTIGRASLRTMLEQLGPQLGEGDECLVLGDGPQPAAGHIVAGIANPRVQYIEHPEVRNWGNPQRNAAITRAKGDLLMFVDDDDQVLRDGVETIRRIGAEHPGRPLMFRIRHMESLIWRTPVVEYANVSGQMFIAPNVPTRVGRWSDAYGADFDYITSTLALYSEGANALVWREEITTIQGLAPR